MRINFTGHQIEITPALKTFTQKKIDKLSAHFDKITNINIVFGVEKLQHTVEATIMITKGEIHASATDENMYTSVDLLIEKLEKQLAKHKEKMREHRE